ncbi:hypothetical protein K1X22_21805 [Mycolicibacterium farcinogenes]|uniref:hypothetical protein n=1 Tax=Mycolicibacterium farcinogenes TaxID=1802 RepID=UPI001C8EFE26|nr:hypothetical protein [Mycolicibacterium farcinogenes]QZH58865.1 hypothetical protein K1X22_21805 [Mycolicibacterium farcinogenes]
MDHRPIDEAITQWAKKQDIGIAYTVPSLVDHRDEETVTQHPDGITRTRPRRAVRFEG